MKRVGIVGLCGLVAVVGVAIFAATSPARVSAVEDVRERQENAFRQGGFRAAAAVTGTYVRTQDQREAAGGSPAELVDRADVIVVGTVVSNRGVMSPSGLGIRTHYVVNSSRVLKGRDLIPNYPQFVLSVLGGRAALGANSWAQLNVPYADPPLNGATYLFFLRRIPDGASVGSESYDAPGAEFWPFAGASGVVGLGVDGRGVIPTDRRSKMVASAAKYEGRSDKLLAEIEKLVSARGQGAGK